jgi:hypothetical protein
MDPAFFATPDEWRAWLAEHHETVPELWLASTRRRPLGTTVQAEPESLAVLPGAAAGVSEDRRLVGHQREGGGDQTAAAGD